MNLAPDQPPPKLRPKFTAQEKQVQREVRLKTILLRMAIWQELDARGITAPADIGVALGMPTAEAHRLLTRHRPEGDMAALEAAAARLGSQTLPVWRSRRHVVDKRPTCVFRRDASTQGSLRPGITTAATLPTVHGMNQPPAPPAKPKPSREERRAREVDRLKSIRLKIAISQALDERNDIDPSAIGEALRLPAAEAIKLLNRHQWREGDVALLETAAARLGVQVPEMPQIFGTLCAAEPERL